MKVTKVKEGLKNQGMRNAPWDKLGDQSGECESAKKAPHEQLKGGSAKKISKSDKK